MTLPGPIPIAGPWVTEHEVAYVADAARRGWYSGAGEYPERFERAFAQHAQRRFAVSLPSCTAGLHLALAALGVGPGDEVIVPDVSWIASSAPVSYVGATPIFADVDPRSWCLSCDSFEAAATPRTRAVIVVDLYGNMPDYDAIVAAAARRGIAVIEDSAESVGATYRGRPAGAFGLASVFSFHGSKTVTTGEGGMLLTDDEPFFKRVAVLRDHGRQPGDRFFYNGEVAFKYKMSAMQAAFGLGQIERITELMRRKREIYRWYREELEGVPGVILNEDIDGVQEAYWMVTAVWDSAYGIGKRQMQDLLRARGVDTRPFFHPLSSLPAYAHLKDAGDASRRNPISYDLASRAVNLPSALMLDREQVARAARAFRAVLTERSMLAGERR